ncbi:alpha/beta fold hydrolase [Bradymonadaceae bacterium TMQ3]|nr:alpha/beta fold hydrolase [Bradymonadaceae bacterium TMQ3]TXC77211.1 lysophospholipase [Bradymonadales bacterium TMQ1]
MREPEFHLAYLHGFASSARSTMGAWLARELEWRGYELHRPELNVPSFYELTFSEALRVMDRLDADVARTGRPWRLIGSSMGGYLAARWAQLNPQRVDRLLLLAPGFDLPARWPHLVGKKRMKRWEEEGALKLPGPDERMQPVSWNFIEDARTHEPWPEVSCPVVIVHGTRDPTVPVASSRRYVEMYEGGRLVEVDDRHQLRDSRDTVWSELVQLFEIKG